MTSTPNTLESLSSDQLDAVTGGGLISQIGGLFGAKGAKIGGVAEGLFGLFKGGGLGSLTSLLGGGKTSAPASSTPASSGSAAS
jgi:hypothetical protein